jgi:hypothetical protein
MDELPMKTPWMKQERRRKGMQRIQDSRSSFLDSILWIDQIDQLNEEQKKDPSQ